MLAHALKYAAAGWYVFPLKPHGKSPITQNGFKDATNDHEQIQKWWRVTPDANIGIACGASGLCVLDVDHGLEAGDLRAWMGRNGLPSTYMVRSGRAEFGAHLYYAGALKDGRFELDGVTGEIRSLGGYVVAAGSLHPHTGNEYVVLSSADVVNVPAIIEQSRVRGTGVADDGQPITEARNIRMTSIVGKLRHQFKAGQDVILEMAERINEDRCQPPLDSEELAGIVAKSFKNYPTPEEVPEVVIGKKAAVEAVEDDDSNDLSIETQARPVYPDSAWRGTAYADFADLCTTDNAIPRKFFIESIRTAVGAIVGDRLGTNQDGVNPRAYTIFVAPPQKGKGTSISRVQDLFSQAWEGLRTSQEPPLLFADGRSMWKRQYIGAQTINPASAPGLMTALDPPQKKKKDGEENAQDPNGWKEIPRLLTLMEEIRGLFANFTLESTGSGLEGILCELFDRTSFSATATAKRPPANGRAMLSILGGITAEDWEKIFSQTSSAGSGFISRLNIIGSDGGFPRASGIDMPDYRVFRTSFIPKITELATRPRLLKPTPGAKLLIAEWFQGVRPEHAARINIHAWRTALHMAWLLNSDYITEDHAARGIEVANYQLKMREYYTPAEGDTRAARCEQHIRKVVRRGPISLADLKRQTNYTRYGVDAWTRCLKTLVSAKEIRLVDREDGSSIRQKSWVIPLKTLE